MTAAEQRSLLAAELGELLTQWGGFDADVCTTTEVVAGEERMTVWLSVAGYMDGHPLELANQEALDRIIAVCTAEVR